jgi:hypothetical protein
MLEFWRKPMNTPPATPSLPATNAQRLRWEQRDEAIQLCGSKLDCFAPLAMTAGSAHSWSSPYSAVRHCEERSDEAIQLGRSKLDCFAALAMTAAVRKGDRATALGARRANHLSSGNRKNIYVPSRGKTPA